uniref:Uncharacterized protein n=1 Tax=Nelumbo nucifera TaxID=4432 RepID=A0A822Y3I0_NELNU|nr:TPA_asm: hypothetical protein HUJ06_028290 [Nelumbo nucifera]
MCLNALASFDFLVKNNKVIQFGSNINLRVDAL